MADGDVDGTADATRGISHRQGVEDTRQAAQVMANDMPFVVNMNAIVSNSQALTFDALGKGFAASQERRQALFDQMATKP